MRLPVSCLALGLGLSILRLAAGDLVEAARRGDAARFQALLAAQPDLSDRDADGNTALHWAAIRGRADWVGELLRHGAPVDATNRLDATPLIFAVANPEAVAALLAARADVHHRSRSGRTPLLAATSTPDSRQVVDQLLRAGAETSEDGTQALNQAAFLGDQATVERLLDAGVRPDQVNGAAHAGQRAIVERLLDAGADLHFTNEGVGHALNAALFGQQSEVARLLVDRGADLTLRSPRGDHQTPPILWAAYSEQGDASVARLMIARGADVNLASLRGETALDWARARHNVELEQVLLAAGARPGTQQGKPKSVPDRKLPPEDTALPPLIRQAATRALELLQDGSDSYLLSAHISGPENPRRCSSCHQQSLPAWAFGLARERGFTLRTVSLARLVQHQFRQYTRDNRVLRTYERTQPMAVPESQLGYGLPALAALGHPADSMTEAFAWFLAERQRADGSWPEHQSRPPMQDGPISSTALVIRALQAYPLPGCESEIRQRLRRGRDYLAGARPITFNQRVYQLLGMGWAGDSPTSLEPLVKKVLERQKPDGGWAQLPDEPSDAWATGQALVALHTVGGLPPTDPAYRRGLRFLLRTQFDDGSWYVRSRSWPLQPHFESGFPHGKDQWISAAGTSWAAMALLLTQPKTAESPPAVDWLAVEVPQPGHPEPAAPATSAAGPASPRTVDFSRDIEPLLERSCAGCHSGPKPKGEFSVASRNDFMKGGQSREAPVHPGRGDASPLLRMVADQVEDLEMPPVARRGKYPALSAPEIATLRRWINEGVSWP